MDFLIRFTYNPFTIVGESGFLLIKPQNAIFLAAKHFTAGSVLLKKEKGKGEAIQGGLIG